MMNATTEKILLIDDDEDDQLFFQQAIQALNPIISCEVAEDGLSGLDLLKTGFLPDLIFLDLNMPSMNGFDFLQHFMQELHWQKIPVVIFTTSSQQRDIDRSRELGARAYMTKPNSVQELHSQLESILRWDFSPGSIPMKIV